MFRPPTNIGPRKVFTDLGHCMEQNTERSPSSIVPAIEKTLAVGNKGGDNLRTVVSFSYIPRQAFRTWSVSRSFNILTNPVRN